MSEGTTGGNGPKSESSEKQDHSQNVKMTPETRERIEGLMHDMMQDGLWGYKNKTDPTEREVAFQSEATAEKLFSYLYADDPVNAKKKWQEFGGKAADKGLISRAEALIIDKNPNAAISGLETDQKRVGDQVKKYLNENDAKSRENQLSSLRVAMGDAEQRQRDFRRRATDQILEKENDVDGVTIINSFFKGATRAADDYMASWREKVKAKDMRKIMAEIAGGVEIKEKNKIFQEARGATGRGFDSAAANMDPANSSIFGMAGVKMAGKNMADIIKKMTGMGRREAEQNAPASVKQLLLPAPSQNLGFKGFGPQGPEMGLST